MVRIATILFLFISFSFGQDGLIITEVADGTNSGGVPKYVEIFNAHATTSYSLNGLQIRRYANGGLVPGNVNLNNVLLAPGQTYVVSNVAFEVAWGGVFATESPDQISGTISGNGDDVYELFNTGTVEVIDVYGVVGVDGTGEAWEYLDSQVTRAISVNDGNNGLFNIVEWIIVPYENLTATPGTHAVDSPLPVELISFVAVGGDKEVILNWSTASEIDNQGFAILRSNDKDDNYQEIDSYESNGALKGAGTTSSQKNYQYIDETVFNGETYWYKLVDVDLSGVRTEHGPISAKPVSVEIEEKITFLPGDYALYQNKPNPFNPLTTIVYDIPELSNGSIEVTLTVFNLLGQKVVTLFEGVVEAGTHRVTWNGLDQSVSQVPSGIYIYQIISDNFSESKRMTLVK